jgi:hypothetical protein
LTDKNKEKILRIFANLIYLIWNGKLKEGMNNHRHNWKGLGFIFNNFSLIILNVKKNGGNNLKILKNITKLS